MSSLRQASTNKIKTYVYIITVYISTFIGTSKLVAMPYTTLQQQLYSATTTYAQKANILIALCDYGKILPSDTLLHYTKLLQQIGVQQQDNLILQTAAVFKQQYFFKKGLLDSFAYFKKNNEITTFSNKDNAVRLQLLNGYYYTKLQNYKDALACYYNGLSIAEVEKKVGFSISCKSGIGWVHMEMNQLQEAIVWFKKALQTTQVATYSYLYSAIETNLASCYGALGQLDSSQKYCTLAISGAQLVQDKYTLANARFVEGNLYLENKNSLMAEKAFKDGFALHQQIGDPFYIVSDMANIAEFYAISKQYTKGIALATQAIAYAQKNNISGKLSMCYGALAFNYKAAGNYKAYAHTLYTLNKIKDSVYTQTSEKVVAEMNTKYETAKKEKIIQRQQFEISKKNIFLGGSLSLLLVTGLLGYMAYRNYKHKQQGVLQTALVAQQHEASKAVLEAEEKERMRLAADLHDGIGQMLTAVKMNVEALRDRIHFTNADDNNLYLKVKTMLEDSCKEVRNVSHNISAYTLNAEGLSYAVKDFVEKTTSNKLKINYSCTGCNEGIDKNIEIMAYRIIQECVNNTIKHANASRLDIAIIKDSEALNVSIEDNGKGFDVTKHSNKIGIGLQNINTRLAFLNGNVDVQSQPNNGTLIAFYIPLNK